MRFQFNWTQFNSKSGTTAPQGYSRVDKFYTSKYDPSPYFQKVTAPGIDEENGSSVFTFEFEVRLNKDAHVTFCDDQEIDLSYPSQPGDKYASCLHLAIGGWGNKRSWFSSSTFSGPQGDMYPNIYTSPLTGNEYRNFKVVFDENGDLSVFNVANSEYQWRDGLEREDGKLVDLSYVTGVNN